MSSWHLVGDTSARGGVLRSVEVYPSSPAGLRVALAASSIAAYLTDGRLPAAKDLFVLSAAVVEAARAGDRSALRTGLNSARALLEQLPHDNSVHGCRGYLKATAEFAWLLNAGASAES